MELTLILMLIMFICGMVAGVSLSRPTIMK
jgi:hypothetical protein